MSVVVAITDLEVSIVDALHADQAQVADAVHSIFSTVGSRATGLTRSVKK